MLAAFDRCAQQAKPPHPASSDNVTTLIRRIGGVEFLEKTYELPRAMPILDTGMNLPGKQVDPGEQAQRAMALVFMIAPPARMRPRLRRQVATRIADRLDVRLLVVGDDRHVRLNRLALAQDRDLASDSDAQSVYAVFSAYLQAFLSGLRGHGAAGNITNPTMFRAATASTPSRSHCGVQPLQLNAGIGCGEMPIRLGVFVLFRLASDQGLFVGNAPVKALS